MHRQSGHHANQPPIAIVTGASSGIGAAMVERLAARGMRVILIARRVHPMQRVVERCDHPQRHHLLKLDLQRGESIEPAVSCILNDLGPVRVLINCAGVGTYKPFLQTPASQQQRLMQINYFAVAELIRIVLPGMLDVGYGHVINIASMSAKVGPWGHSAYAPAKAALVSLTQTLASEYSSEKICFSYVNPGIIKTEYFENPELAQLWPRVEKYAIAAETAARQILCLLDRPHLELCIPRHYRVMDWIRALSPRLALRLVDAKSRPVPTQRLPEAPGPEFVTKSRKSDSRNYPTKSEYRRRSHDTAI